MYYNKCINIFLLILFVGVQQSYVIDVTERLTVHTICMYIICANNYTTTRIV